MALEQLAGGHGQPAGAVATGHRVDAADQGLGQGDVEADIGRFRRGRVGFHQEHIARHVGQFDRLGRGGLGDNLAGLLHGLQPAGQGLARALGGGEGVLGVTDASGEVGKPHAEAPGVGLLHHGGVFGAHERRALPRGMCIKYILEIRR